jgi:hypothetical protein
MCNEVVVNGCLPALKLRNCRRVVSERKICFPRSPQVELQLADQVLAVIQAFCIPREHRSAVTFDPREKCGRLCSN